MTRADHSTVNLAEIQSIWTEEIVCINMLSVKSAPRAVPFMLHVGYT